MESSLRDSAPEGVRVLETLRYDPQDSRDDSRVGCVRMALHVARAERTCAALGFAFDRVELVRILDGVKAEVSLRLRVSIGADGIALEKQPFIADGDWRFGLSGVRVSSADPWLQVKTTQRALYNQARLELTAGLDEVVFMNENGHLCEGTITNLFVQKDDGLVTPPLSCGVLPGVLRADLLAQGKAREGIITVADLAEEQIFLGNSLRGLISAQFIGTIG